MHASPRPAQAGRLTTRTILILAIACSIGALAGILTYLAARSVAQALLAAGSATGGTSGFARQILGPDPRPLGSIHTDDDQDDVTE